MSELSAYHARLPYGERVSPEPVLGGPFFPFDGDLQVRPLDEPVVPEPPRNGEPGNDACDVCADRERAIWQNSDWMVHAGLQPTGLPMFAMLSPVEHVTLLELPEHLVAGWGAMIQRMVRAIGQIDGVGRVHFSRWGDSIAHLHMWFLARPLGMMQLRGPMLAVWDDLLPHLPDEELRANIRTVVAGLEA